MPRRTGSWERFHHHIRWSRPPRPAPAAAPVVPPAGNTIRRSPRPAGTSAASDGREPSGLGDIIRSLWNGLIGSCRGRTDPGAEQAGSGPVPSLSGP